MSRELKLVVTNRTSPMAKPSVFFPEPMDFLEIVCPSESAYYAMKEIAHFGHVQLLDINDGNVNIQKRYVDEYMQCEEAERSLRFIESHLRNSIEGTGKPYMKPAPKLEESQNLLFNQSRNDAIAEISEYDHQLHEKVSLYQQLSAQNRQRTKKLEALRFYRPIIEQETPNRLRTMSDSSSVPSMELALLGDGALVSAVTGFAPTEQIRRLITTVYRVSRRNVISHVGESDGHNTVYSLFTSSSTVLEKIIKICQSYSPDVFEFPSDIEGLQRMENELVDEINQQSSVDNEAISVNRELLAELSEKYWNWRIFIAQEKQIYLHLGFADYDRVPKMSVFNGWCPRRLTPQLTTCFSNATLNSGSAISIQLTSTPAETLIEENLKQPIEEQKEIVVPTFIQKNSFTSAFQMLNNAYGIPDYDELNGGAFYCMYPFLFAIMFGDAGHSLFYIGLAIALLVLDPIAKRNNWDLGEMGGSVFKFKWLLLFAALCSLYTGILYNETFGLPINVFGSHYELDTNKTTDSMKYWLKKDKGVYAFGMDPVWFFKDNELIFMNSFKMKLSVVMGMSQMVFGMFLSLINHVHRHDVREILVKWIPEMLYLVPFFGYLVCVIIKKWMTNFNDDQFIPEVQKDGVNLIQMMIGMLLSFGQKPENLELYPSQWTQQQVIVIIFIVSIPYLLFAKPILECFRLRGTPNFSVLEIFVMNLIGVIEFCLGALSHTASYLRLWALSLAHSQLSHVLYEELFLMTLNTHNVFLLFVGFAAFATLTVCILLAMEAFSALLHAIRLMWVEFSSKFYAGMGTQFKPLAFKKAMRSIGVR